MTRRRYDQTDLDMALAGNSTTNIPATTIRRYQTKAMSKLAHIGRKAILTVEEESDLANYMR